MFSLHTYRIQFLLQNLIITLTRGCGQKTVYVNIIPFYSPYILQVIKSQGWSPVLLWEEIIEAGRFTAMLTRTRQSMSARYKLKKKYAIFMSETALVNLKFGKNLQAAQTYPSTTNNEAIWEKFLLFLEWSCTKFWPFFYKIFAKRINKCIYLKPKLKFLPPTVCFRLT